MPARQYDLVYYVIENGKRLSLWYPCMASSFEAAVAQLKRTEDTEVFDVEEL